jgi:HSP20 family protein
MNTLKVWNPLQELNGLHRRWASLLDGNYNLLRPGNLVPDDENITVSEWVPLVDIAEDDKEYLIKVELPEVQKDNVNVTVENGALTIKGERKAEMEEKGRKFHRVERSYGCFERNFSIPDDADGAKVKAEFKDGILRVHLAKSEKVRPKQIEITVT